MVERRPILDFFTHLTLILGVIVIALPEIALFTRILRNDLVRTLREDYVLAAQLMGANSSRIIGRHLVPGFMSHLIATATISSKKRCSIAGAPLACSNSAARLCSAGRLPSGMLASTAERMWPPVSGNAWPRNATSTSDASTPSGSVTSQMRRRSGETKSMQGFREEASSESVDFTARDKQTTVESADSTS